MFLIPMCTFFISFVEAFCIETINLFFSTSGIQPIRKECPLVVRGKSNTQFCLRIERYCVSIVKSNYQQPLMNSKYRNGCGRWQPLLVKNVRPDPFYFLSSLTLQISKSIRFNAHLTLGNNQSITYKFIVAGLLFNIQP